MKNEFAELYNADGTCTREHQDRVWASAIMIQAQWCLERLSALFENGARSFTYGARIRDDMRASWASFLVEVLQRVDEELGHSDDAWRELLSKVLDRRNVGVDNYPTNSGALRLSEPSKTPPTNPTMGEFLRAVERVTNKAELDATATLFSHVRFSDEDNRDYCVERLDIKTREFLLPGFKKSA